VIDQVCFAAVVSWALFIENTFLGKCDTSLDRCQMSIAAEYLYRRPLLSPENYKWMVENNIIHCVEQPQQ